MLDSGCDLTVRSHFGQTAMDIAVFRNDGSMMELLRMYTLEPTSLQLSFNSVKQSLSSKNPTRNSMVSDEDNSDQFSRIYNNSENLLNKSGINKEKTECRHKFSPKSSTDRFANAYFQFPSAPYNKLHLDQSISSCTACGSPVFMGNANSS